ncbi:hypothetical protein ACTNDY_08260 [Tissierellaceae bacterium HCP3S3_D8]|jgi:hypothetical protein
MGIKYEYEMRLDSIDSTIGFIEEFLINNTRGYYLKAIKKERS